MMAPRHRNTRIPSSNSTATNQPTTSTAFTTIPGPGQPSGTMATSAPSVRRNLFHAHQSHNHHPHMNRRQAPSDSSHAGGDNTLNNGALPNTGVFNPSKPISTTSSSISTAPPLENGDIVARDKNGCYKVDIPILPSAMFGEDVDGGDAMEGIEHVGGAGAVADAGGPITETEKEKIDATIAEMMRHNRSRQINGEPSEVLLLIQQTLRTRVAELEEDKWMFEVDDDINV